MGFRILPAASVMAFCIGIKGIKDTTSRLHGYGCVLLVVKSLACMNAFLNELYKVFSRCATMFLSIGYTFKNVGK